MKPDLPFCRSHTYRIGIEAKKAPERFMNDGHHTICNFSLHTNKYRKESDNGS